MKINGYLVILVSLLMCLAISGVSAADDAFESGDIATVSSVEIEDNEILYFNQIQTAVNSASNGDTVYLNNSYYVSKGTVISVSKSITIDGSSNGVADHLLLTEMLLQLFSQLKEQIL